MARDLAEYVDSLLALIDSLALDYGDLCDNPYSCPCSLGQAVRMAAENRNMTVSQFLED